jgi:hypothetical protein
VWHVTPEELAPVRRDEGDASVPGLGEGRPDDVSDPLIGERRRDERECDVARDRLGVRFDAAELPTDSSAGTSGAISDRRSLLARRHTSALRGGV